MEIRVKRVLLSEDESLAHSYESTDELYHWGIKGMKWGVRRYQNKDGSLTAAGQKHRRSLGQYVHDKRVAKKRREAAAKARDTKAKNAAEKAKRERLLAKGKIPVKKMTDEELARSMKRLDDEKRYLEKVRETSTFERFKYKLVNETIIPSVTEAGKAVAKSYLEEQGKKLLGMNQKSAHEKLKEAAEAARLTKEMYENKQALDNAKKNRALNDAVDKAKAEAELAKAKKDKVTNDRQAYDQTGKFEAEKAADKAASDAVKKAEAQKEVDAYNTQKSAKDSEKDGLYKMKGTGENKSLDTDIKEEYNKIYDKDGNRRNDSSGSNSSSNSSQKTNNKSVVKETTIKSGEIAVRNTAMNTSISTINKANVNDGVAWVESASGEFLNTTSYKERK